jgi:DNA-binding IclR family transcriptional regulator
MLAAMPEPQVAAMFDDAAALPALTKRSVTRLRQLQAELRLVRERGYALNREESEDGVASVAVAVVGRPDSPVAALVVSAPVTRLDAESSDRIAARLRAEADRLAVLSGPQPGFYGPQAALPGQQTGPPGQQTGPPGPQPDS